jgi:hypothetical protein
MLDTRICPGSASDISRAAIGLARPSTSSGLAPALHVLRAVAPGHQLADVDAHARGQRRALVDAELAQRLLVAQGEIDRLDRTLEDREQAVGLVDQACRR